MHDPDTVAFEIRRPWPERTDWGKPPKERWRFKLHHDCAQDCEHEPFQRDPFPWWKPRSWTPFWTIAGRRYYFPAVVTVWHREPGGRDSGEVCSHWKLVAGKQEVSNAWRWHVRHWRVQLLPLQHLRRRLLTRCTWCGGSSRKGDLVNCAAGWDTPRSRWWQGERDLFHGDCQTVEHAHRRCLCDSPVLDHSGYGTCARCGKFRGWRQEPDEAGRLLAALPHASRIPSSLRPRLEALWAEKRAEESRP